MRPAAISLSLSLTAEAVCWELPLGRPWGSPLLTGLASVLLVTSSPFPSPPFWRHASSSTLPGGSRLAWESEG